MAGPVAHVIHRVLRAGLILDLWPAVRPYADAAMRVHPFMDADDLLTMLLQGKVTLFVCEHKSRVIGFGALEVIQYPRRRVANVLAAGGEIGLLSATRDSFLDIAEAWAREQSADTLAVTGRPGWARVLARRGGTSLSLVSWHQELGDGQRRRQTDHDQ